jgi:ABC-type polysaccharide/polyol phosphate export permease
LRISPGVGKPIGGKPPAREPAFHMLSLTWGQLESAADDLRTGVSCWQLSQFLAWQDIKQRYRRSTLGPLWLTLSFGVQMLTMGVLSAFLFNLPITKSLPFVCAGMLFWSLITQMITEGATLFVTASRYITQIKSPLTIFVLQAIWRNVFVTAHNAVIYIVIALTLAVIPGPSLLLWPFGFILVIICLTWIALVTAVVSARYRDVPLMIQNILGVVFWFTPLIYFPEQLGTKRFIADYNPLTHIIALVREPLLGGAPSLNDWLIVLALAVIGWTGTFLFFARFRARVVYWL